IIPHTTSETYKHIPNIQHLDDVYLLDMPKVKEIEFGNLALMEDFMDLREDVLKALENARNEKIIGKSLNAHLKLYPKPKVQSLLEKLNIPLAQAFIVSKLEILTTGFGKYKGKDITIDVLSAEGHVCDRCWQVVEAVNDDGICERCETIIDNI
ncbi:MAG TPA: class I tRNA ligase family protein, partial [Candidatus Izemoplasmatales bacterium]|nr:class I tRNA ligase family protein [Candidatus Izemoplasmatales bacterium]